MENLLKLSRKTIPTFMEIYKAASYPRHVVTCSAFKNVMIQTEKYPEYRDNIQLYTLNEEWQKDGLFLIKNGRSYYFDSVEPQPFDRLKKLLLKIDYSEDVVFRAVRDLFKPMINDVLWLKNLEITDQTGTTVYMLPRDVILKLIQPPIPEGWYFRDLTLDDVNEINEKLLREGGDNIGYIENTIKYKLSLGLFDETGKLQAWLYGCDIGTHGTLGVTDGHQQKGAASAISVKFAQTLLRDIDMDLVWNTAHGNEKAHGMAAKFNGRATGTVTWMKVSRKVHNKMTQMGMYQIFFPKM